MTARVLTEPAIEPVSLADFKLHAKVDQSADDGMIPGLIKAARIKAEKYTGRAFVTKTIVLGIDYWFPDEIGLPWPPALSVTSIDYIDANGATQTLAGSVYQTDLRSEPARIRLADSQSWPGTRGRDFNAVVVTYTAGYGAIATDVPETIRTAVLMLAANLYKYREATAEHDAKEVPFAVRSMLDPYRMVRI